VTKYFTLPDGSAIRVPDEMTYGQAVESAKKKFPELYAPVAPPPQGGFIPAVKSGFAGLKGDIAALAGRSGLMDTAAAEQYRKEQQDIAAKTFKPTEEGWSESPFAKIKELAGQSLPYMAAPIAAAGAATLGAPALGLGAVGAGLAGAGAGALASATQFTGSNLSRQIEEGKALKDTDLGAAALAAIPQAALDTVSMRMIPGLGRLFGAAGLKLTEKEAKTLAEQGLMKTLGEYTFKTGTTAGVEGLTEAAQQVFERLQAGLSLTDPEARKEYFDNFVGGAVLGGVISPAGQYMERSKAITEAKKVADEKLTAANKARQDAEEAEKSKPENLLKLLDDYEAAKAQMQQMATAIKKPGKKASDEEKAAYQQAKEAATEFKANTFEPLRQEYEARKTQLAPLLAERQRYASLETAAAAQQPTEGRIETPVQTLMAQYETLNQQTNALATQLQQAATAGDTQAHTALLNQYKAIEAQKQNLAGLIEQQGGVAGFETTRPPQEFQGLPGHVAALDKLEKDIETLSKKVAQAGETGDFEAQNKHLAELAAAKTQQAALQQDIERRRLEIGDQQARAGTGMGETLPMFSEQTAPTPGPDVADVEAPASIAGIARTPAQAKPIPKRPPREAAAPTTPDMFEQAAEEDRIAAERAAAEAQAAQERTNRERGQTLPLFTEEEAPIPPAEVEDTAPPQYDYTKSEWPYETSEPATSETPTETTKEEADAEFEKARRDKFWATAPSKAGGTPTELDLFSDANLIRSDINNGNFGLLNNIERAKEKEARTQGLDAKAAERRRLEEALDRRLNLAGTKLTRTVTPKEFDAGMEKIAQIKRRIENPQGNAKKSLLQQAVDAYAAREKYTEILNSGVMPLLTPEGKPAVFPTWLKGIEKAANRINYGKPVVPGEFTGVEPITLKLKDKVAALAAQKKGETSLTRPLTNREKYAIQRKIDAAEAKYNEPIAQIAPDSQKIFSIYQGMHETAPLRKAANIARTKEDAVDALGRSRNKVSKEAATAARIAAGDVEQEAASSLELRQLALNEGRKTEAYKQARSEWVVKRDKIIKKYGKESEAYIRLTDAAKVALQAVGIKEGAKSQVYKDALKAATERLKAATAGSEQKQKTKRTEQVVRKSTVEPSTMRTGSTESKEGATTTKVKRGATSAGINPKRKPFVATEETPDITPPAQETTPRSATDKREAPTVDPKAPRKPKKGETPVAPATTASREETPEEARVRLKAVADEAKKVLVKENARLGTFRKELADLEAELKDSEAKLKEEERQGRGTPTLELVREYQSRIANQKAAIKEQLRVVTDAQTTYTNAVSASLVPFSPAKPPEAETKPVEVAETTPAETKPVEVAETKPAETKPPEAGTKPVETTPPEAKLTTTSPEQRDRAESIARTVGGVVEWQDGDLALVRGFARNGLPVYVGVNKYNYTRVDIADFKESTRAGARLLFTPEEQTRLIAIKDKLEAEADAKHAQTPFVKFDSRGLALSDSLSEEFEGVIAGWKKLLGLDANIYVGLIDDIAADKDKYTGPHRAIASSLVNTTEGSMRKMVDGSYYITFNASTSTTKMFEVLAHEMGHVHQKEVFNKASTTTQSELTKAHEAWLTETKGLDGAELIKAARSYKTSRYDATPDQLSDTYKKYLTSFNEWYADNTAKWAMSSAKPQGVVEQFFSRLGATLRNFYKSLKGQGYLPNETFRQYMDKLAANNDTLPLLDTGAPQQTLDGMEAEAMKMPDALTDMLQGERITSSSAAALVAENPSLYAEVRAGNLGLRLRQLVLDSWASIDSAVTKGMDKKVLTSLEGEQAMYYLRAGENRNAYVNQAITHGPLSLNVQNTPQGKSITFNSTKGATLMRVAELAGKAELGNEATTEAYFTAYIAGQRAEVVGWEKLNTNPKVAKDAYAEITGLLRGNQKAKDAFEAAAKEYKAYNKGLIDFAVQCGALSKKVGDQLNATPYVPFYRIDSGNVILDLGGESIIRIGNIKQQPNLKELVGSNRKIMPLYTSAIQNTAMLTEMALRNLRTKNTCYTLLKLGAIKRIGEGDGPEGAVRFKENGVKKHAVVDTDTFGIPADMFVKSMEGIATSMPYIIRLMGMPANWLRLAVTRMPAYAIRQAIRDPLTAWMTTGTDGVPIIDGMKELTKMVRGRSPEEERLMAAGAITSNVYTGDQQDMARFLRDMQSGKSGWEKLMGKADALALKGDASTRVLVYKDSIAKGMTELQALMRAQESMNFSRRGLSPSVRMLSTLIPFFNAQLQGLDVLYRAMRGQMPHNERLEIQKKLFARGALMTATTMAYVALMHDDEAYKKAKPEERYNNFFVRIPGLDEPFRVPIPFELGYLFKAIPEAAIDVAFNDESASKALGGIGKLLWMSNPLSLPQAVKPLTEVVLNKSFFGGDIESAREQGLKAAERYRPGTTELAKLIGSVTGEVGLSPVKIDYLVRGYTGSAGIAVMSLLNPLLKEPAPGGKEVQEPTKPLSKNILIGGLFQPNDGRGILDEAYAQMNEVKQAQNTYKKKVDEGDIEGAREFAVKYADELALAKVSGAAYKQLGEWAKQERQITKAPKLTTEQKDILIKRLRNAQNTYAERMLKTVRQAEGRTTLQ
jgi:hypothetical protein